MKRHTFSEVVPSERKGRQLRNSLAAFFLIILILLIPNVSSAPSVVSEIIYTTAPVGQSTSRTMTVAHPVGNTAYSCYTETLSSGPSWSNIRKTTNDNGQTASSIAVGSGDGNTAGYSCSLGLGGRVVGVRWAGTVSVQTTCSFATISGGSDSRTFSGLAGGCSDISGGLLEPLFFSSTDYGFIYSGHYVSWNGVSQVVTVLPATFRVDSAVDTVNPDIGIIAAGSDGRLYTAKPTSIVSGITFTQIISSGIPSNFKPNIVFDGTTWTICYVQGTSLIRSTSTDFLSWTPATVTTTATSQNCIVFPGSLSVVQGSRLYYNDGSGYSSIIYTSHPLCTNIDGSISTYNDQVDGYNIGSDIYLWGRDCNASSQQQLASWHISGSPVPSSSVGTNFVSNARDYFSVSWGVSTDTANWLFGLLISGLIIFGFAKAKNMFLTVVGTVLGVGVCLALGLFPVWILFLLAFIGISFTWISIYRSKGNEE